MENGKGKQMSKLKAINGFTRARMLCELSVLALTRDKQKDSMRLLLQAISEIAGELEEQQKG